MWKPPLKIINSTNGTKQCISSIHSITQFQNQLKTWNGLEDVKNLLKENFGEYTRVFKKSCGNCLSLNKSIFCCLQLGDKLFKVWVTVLDNGVDSFPQEIELDEQLKTMDKKDDLQNTPKLAQYQWNLLL